MIPGAFEAWIRDVLLHLYMHTASGPFGLGGWDGKPLERICAELTGLTHIDTWVRNPQDCVDIVQQRIYSVGLFAVLCFGSLGCALLAYKCLAGLCCSPHLCAAQRPDTLARRAQPLQLSDATVWDRRRYNPRCRKAGWASRPGIPRQGSHSPSTPPTLSTGSPLWGWCPCKSHHAKPSFTTPATISPSRS